jgi:hypothetical protein
MRIGPSYDKPNSPASVTPLSRRRGLEPCAKSRCCAGWDLANLPSDQSVMAKV